MKRKIIFITIAFVLASLYVASVQARGATFIVEPAREAVDTAQLNISEGAVGNVSVENGFVDFYITSPSGLVILCYNKIAFESFNFTAEENGTYTMHLANNNQEASVSVLLYYVVKFNVVLKADINAGFSLGKATVLPSPVLTPPFDWTEVVGLLKTVGYLIALTAQAIHEAWKRWKDRNWQKKYKDVVRVRPL